MLTGDALTFYKNRMLRMLDVYAGTEARTLMLATDFQVACRPDARPDDIRQALDSLAGDGLARRRQDTLRGEVWAVTPAGHAAAAKLEIEEP